MGDGLRAPGHRDRLAAGYRARGRARRQSGATSWDEGGVGDEEVLVAVEVTG